jgi:hypothetical protein
MKMRSIVTRIMTMCFVAAIVFSFSYANAQTDSTKVAAADTTAQKKGKDEKEKKRKDEFILYAGVNFSMFAGSTTAYESSTNLGYDIGAAYKRGKFFYWQVGAQFNNTVYDIHPVSNSDSTDFVGVRNLQIPITGGMNLLAPLNRIVALRLYISAMPSFALGVGDNKFGFTKSDINTFIFYAQGGLGVDIAFIVLDVGYNYGFQDQFKDFSSTPGQLYVNLGFRF